MEAALAQARLTELLGDGGVVTDPETLSAYASDITEAPAGRPELVAKPESAEEVREVIRFAAAERVPVVPAVARMNVGGLTIPREGGIVLDMSGMDRIVELDREHMYAVVEPGVTFAQLKERLDAEAPELTLSFPLAPPYTSVLANFLLDGLGNLSLRHGSAGEQIGGLEAVLADGTLVRTGACAVSPVWFARGPLPDLTGLFVNWQGSTGVVTKLAVQLWRRPRHSRRLFAFTELEGAFGVVRDLTHADVCRDLSALTWPTSKMLLGADAPLTLDPGEPEVFVYFDVGDDDRELFARKEKVARKVVASHAERGLPVAGIVSIDELVEVVPSLARFAEFPMTLDFLLDRAGGGLTWVGTYGPTAAWEKAATRCRDLMLSRRVPPLLVTRPMKGGHYGVLRMITCFDKSDAEEVERVRELNADLLDICLEHGFIPYKAPDWAHEAMESLAHPGYLELLSRVKTTLDPDGIMNPGRLHHGGSAAAG